MQHAGYHHVNFIAANIKSEIQDQLSQRETQMMAMA